MGDIRARRFEERCRIRRGRLIKECWKEKEEKGWMDLYGKKRGRFYERYEEMEKDRIDDRRIEDTEGWEMELINRERERERREGNSKLARARYNCRYRELVVKGRVPRYLRKENLEKLEMSEGIRALVKLRCGNL